MDEKLQQLKKIAGELSDLGSISALLGWDQQTYMPSGGAEGRGNQQSTLARLIHERSTSPELGQLIADLMARVDEWDPNSDEARMVRMAERDYKKRTRVPAEFVAEFAQETSRAHEAWVRARKEAEYNIFRPHLEHIVDLQMVEMSG